MNLDKLKELSSSIEDKTDDNGDNLWLGLVEML
jgi:hypothetical protein